MKDGKAEKFVSVTELFSGEKSIYAALGISSERAKYLDEKIVGFFRSLDEKYPPGTTPPQISYILEQITKDCININEVAFICYNFGIVQEKAHQAQEAMVMGQMMQKLGGMLPPGLLGGPGKPGPGGNPFGPGGPGQDDDLFGPGGPFGPNPDEDDDF